MGSIPSVCGWVDCLIAICNVSGDSPGGEFGIACFSCDMSIVFVLLAMMMMMYVYVDDDICWLCSAMWHHVAGLWDDRKTAKLLKNPV